MRTMIRILSAAAIISLAATASDGTRQWSRIWGSTDYDEPWAVGVDTAGYVYAAGRTFGSFDGQTNSDPSGWTYNMFVTKWSPVGAKQWTRFWGTNASASVIGLCNDRVGSVCLAFEAPNNLNGTTTHVAYSDFGVMKVASDGTPLWTRIWGSADHDTATGIAADPSGNILFSGYTQGTIPGLTNYGGPQDVCVTKFAVDGARQWMTKIGSAARDFSGGIAADSSGNSFVAGMTEGFMPGATNMGAQDAFLVRCSSAGTWDWTVVWGTTGNDRALAVAIDGNDNVYVAGDTEGQLGSDQKPGAYDMFLAKFSVAGVLQWIRLVGSPSEDRCGGVCVDNANNVYLAGKTLGSFDNQTNTRSGWFDCCLTKFDAAGEREWTRIWGSSHGDGGLAAASFDSNAVYVSAFAYGSFDGQTNISPGVNEDAALTKFGTGTGGTLSLLSENPTSGVAIALDVPDAGGQSNGVTPFTRLYSTSRETTALAAPTVAGRIFGFWWLDGMLVTNDALFIHVHTNRTATACYLSDSFTAAQPLIGMSGAVTSHNGRATVESGEPPHGNWGPYRSLWFQFVAPTDGVLNVTISTSTFTTVMAIYTGTSVTSLTQYAKGGGAVAWSNCQANATYYLAVDSYNSWDSGLFAINWRFTPFSPYHGMVVFNEFLATPAAVPQSYGEWVELKNTTNTPIPMTGWHVQQLGGGEPGTLPATKDVLPVNGFAVLCRNTNSMLNGGLTNGIPYSAMNLAASDSLCLLDAQSQIVDQIVWTSATTGKSRELFDPWADNYNASGTGWLDAVVMFGAGDYGTPGAENSTYVPEPAVAGSAFVIGYLLLAARKRSA